MSTISDNGSAPAKRGAPRWMWITLVTSLALNLLVVGIVGGAAWSWRHGKHWGMHGFGGPMASYLRTLPDERRTEFRKSIRAHFSEMRPLWRAVRKARRNVAEVVKADVFSKEDFETAMEALRQAEFEARKSMIPMLADLASKLTPEERAKFMRHLKRHHKWKGRHHGAPFEMEKDGETSSMDAPIHEAPTQKSSDR